MVLRVLWHSSSLGERRPEGLQLSQRALSLMVHRPVDIVNLSGATTLLSGQQRQLTYPTSFLEYAKVLVDQFHLAEARPAL
jgi:hypothetical protein